MALTVVQSTLSANIGTGTNPKTHAFGSNVTVGSLLTMCTGGTGNATSVSGVTDSLGNAWSRARRYYDATANQYSEIWYATAGSSGACTVSVTFTGGTLSTNLALGEVSGWTATPIVAHQTATALGNGTTHTFGAITTPASTDSYVLGHGRNGTAFTQTTGPTDSFTERIDGANTYIVDRILTGTATVQPAFDTSASELFALNMASFIPNPFYVGDAITVADVASVVLSGLRPRETVTVADVATVLLRKVLHSEAVQVADVATVTVTDRVLRVSAIDRVTVTEHVALRNNKLVVRASEAITVQESALNHGAAGELGPSPSPVTTQADYWTVGI